MATVTSVAEVETVEELLHRLGDIPPARVRMKPTPGTAIEQDVLDAWHRDRRRCELVDGTLVEKAVGHQEGYLAMWLGHFINSYLDRHNIGYCAGAEAMMRIAPHLVRLPDVSFISWERLGSRLIPKTPVPNLFPDLAVEVISEGNTAAEMERKLHEYFDAGIPLEWYIYPATRTVRVFTSPEHATTIGAGGVLEGGDILPGFHLPLVTLFGSLEG
ncbi:MAG: hypothetical protein JWN86_3764 [Planctomycetota bacterium]|nr:hypothetical protein [Planctomycetota bacterium]